MKDRRVLAEAFATAMAQGGARETLGVCIATLASIRRVPETSFVLVMLNQLRGQCRQIPVSLTVLPDEDLPHERPDEEERTHLTRSFFEAVTSGNDALLAGLALSILRRMSYLPEHDPVQGPLVRRVNAILKRAREITDAMERLNGRASA